MPFHATSRRGTFFTLQRFSGLMDTVVSLRYYPAVSLKKRVNAEEIRQLTAEMLQHVDHLYRVAFHLAKDRDHANDCVQETYLRALNSAEQFKPGTNMKAWLTRI